MNKQYLLLAFLVCAMSLAVNCNKKNSDRSSSSRTNQVAVETTDNYAYTVSAFRNNASWSMDNAQWAQLSQGLTIGKGAWIETGQSSAATLSGSLGDMVMMGEKSKVRLLVEELSRLAGETTIAGRGIEMLKGVARFSIKKDPSGFMVQTPSAIIRVKGTRFVVSYDESTRLTDVQTLEGLVEVQDRKELSRTIELNKSEELIGIGGSIEAVRRPITEADRALMPQFEQADTTSESSESVVLPATRNPAEVRAELSRESEAITGKATSAERARAQEAIDKERSASQRVMDSVRQGYQQAKAKGIQEYGRYEADERTRVDSARTAGRSSLDAERQESRASLDSERAKLTTAREKVMNAARSSDSTTSGKANDAFDELERRKNSQ